MAALVYAVRAPVVFKYVGQLGLMLAVLSLPPLMVAVAYAEHGFALRLLAITAFLATVGIASLRLPTPRRIQGNEALTVTALAFVLAAALMAFPLSLEGLCLEDALFESVSGVTTTGLSSLATVEHRSRSFLFLRSWMQWYGGLGMVVLSIALLMGHHAAVRRLFEPVATGETLASTTRLHSRRVLGIYVALTITGALALWAAGADVFNASVHTFSGVSTGGFSSFDGSLAGLPGRSARWVLSVITLCGAVSLPLYPMLWRGEAHRLTHDVELHALLLVVLVVTGTLGLLLSPSTLPALDGRWSHAFYLGISAPTTSGFSSLSVSELPPAAKLVLISAMALGGSVGSTAGGIKLLRLLIIIRLVQLTIQRSAMPEHAVAAPHLGGRQLAQDDFLRAILVATLFGTAVLASWLVFLVYGYPPLDSLFEVVSATVGLSTGIVRPELESALKWLLMVDMLLGRLEFVAWLVLVYPPNWIGKRGEYP